MTLGILSFYFHSRKFMFFHYGLNSLSLEPCGILLVCSTVHRCTFSPILMLLSNICTQYKNKVNCSQCFYILGFYNINIRSFNLPLIIGASECPHLPSLPISCRSLPHLVSPNLFSPSLSLFDLLYLPTFFCCFFQLIPINNNCSEVHDFFYNYNISF